MYIKGGKDYIESNNSLFIQYVNNTPQIGTKTSTEKPETERMEQK